MRVMCPSLTQSVPMVHVTLSILFPPPQEHPSGLTNLVVPTGGDGDGGDGTVSLDGDGHVDHPAHPASADDEDGLFFSLSSLLQWLLVP